VPFDRELGVRLAVAGAKEVNWADPDMEVLRLHRRPPPALPLGVFGTAWSRCRYWLALRL
jgi:hypothetical protein